MTARVAKTRWVRRVLLVLGLLVLVLSALAAIVRLRYGGGSTDFPDLTTDPELPASALEEVAALPLPPGNLAVSAEGRLFFSFHPEAFPATRVAEWRDGRAVPYPSVAFQGPGRHEPFFDQVLSLRIDRQGRLWTLDLARHGLGQPRLLAFDLASDRMVHRFDFPAECAGLGSHMNDFQVSPDGGTIFIADASFFAKTPALVVYDIERRTCRRRLEGHPSVTPEPYIPVVQGRVMQVFALVAIRPGVDSIALDKAGEWLYFAPVTSRHLYRVRAADLTDSALADEELGRRVERFAAKTMSDGISMDTEGNVYLTDLEHSALVRLDREGALATLVESDRLRWPDGLSFGPGGWLYVSCSALHYIFGKTTGQMRSQAPFHIFRLRPGTEGVPGH